MRVAFYGNICNNHFQIAAALRNHAALEAHVYVDEGSEPQQLPENDEPELAREYPDWVHKGPYWTQAARLAPWRSPLVRELRQFDVVILSGFGPMFAPFLGRPAVFLVSGGDLTLLPFPWEFRFWYPTLRGRLVSHVLGFWQRRGIRACSEIWTQPFAPFVTAVEKLGLARERLAPGYLPVVMDTKRIRFHSGARERPEPWIREATKRFDFIVFHPSRMMLRRHPSLVATGQWKQNDLLLRAFGAFVQETGARRAGLVLIDRPASLDVQEAKRLTSELGIEEQVLWLTPPRPFGFTREELSWLYSAADVVADDFGVGWFGSVVLEGLAVGKPVMCYVAPEPMSRLYPWHPLLSARSIEENAAFLKRLYQDPQLRTELGGRGRDWVEAFHSRESTGRIYAAQIHSVLQRANGERPVMASVQGAP